ncbi:fungal-specific transcription factor domain-containing protein [Dactylonectria macrodidyma]|uniref:Fungal-specific transcription factor domain-containing protein n=1 Tax=Dactylonectria macrodidyma TaxID=307937 RepID=A0A9P9D035_9HYPO|nr:fungal-specific transcription factor domain-containing protein [Dactylonectria macrodidyma]
MDSDTKPLDTPQPAPKARKRNTAGADADTNSEIIQPLKRGKYTSIACDECKKRKLKCIPAGDSKCERCVSTGLTCVFASRSSRAVKDKHVDSQQFQTLSDELSQLRQQVQDLVGVVRDLKEQSQEIRSDSSHPREIITIESPAWTPREGVPKQPQFVGPTRSAFSIMMGERSLNRMCIPTFESSPPSSAQSPTLSRSPLATDIGYWDHCTASDITKFLVVFQEEVESVYPFIDIGEYALRSQEILAAIRNGSPLNDDVSDTSSVITLSSKDIEIAKVAAAIGIVLETNGANDLSSAIVESVERNVARISNPRVDLKEVQLLTMLSIYHFHCDEELLAWRAIGIAAREALEMGLHRNQSLLDNFKDPDSRRLAIRVFWCVYVLDRRWSFGTSLSFALIDKDIDSELPEPDAEFSCLKCMVGYGRLCSKLWDAIPPFGSVSQTIPDDTAVALDLCTQEWLKSIPSHLQLRHPRLGLAPRSQSRLLFRLRALLYLRGNYARILIYRHHLMSAASISANPNSAWLVVNFALDTIQVLMHLHATSDIYSRQQNAFNYFLLSAMAVIFLAVCHAPAVFAVPCRKPFLGAVELVRGLSRHSIVSRRLWKSIRGLVPRMRTLSLLHLDQDLLDGRTAPNSKSPAPLDSLDVHHAHVASGTSSNRRAAGSVRPSDGFPLGEMMLPHADLVSSAPDMFQMRDDLLSLFDAFGQRQQIWESTNGEFSDSQDLAMMNGEGEDISQRFQGLI